MSTNRRAPRYLFLIVSLQSHYATLEVPLSAPPAEEKKKKNEVCVDVYVCVCVCVGVCFPSFTPLLLFLLHHSYSSLRGEEEEEAMAGGDH